MNTNNATLHTDMAGVKAPWIVRFTQWREQHISAKNFTLILAVLVGLCSAFAALTLKTLIHAIQHFLTENFHINEANSR